MTVGLDMYQTAGVGVIALLLGMLFTRKIPFLKRFCIPAPVSGGIVIALLTLALYSFGGLEMDFDGTIKEICMTLFFTSVGFQSNMKALRTGGKTLVVMVILVAVLIIFGTAESTGYTDLRWLVQLIIGAGLAIVAGNKGEVFK